MSQHEQSRVATPDRIELPRMSAAEQTRQSWARLIRSEEELPEIYRSFVATLPTAGAFPYVVLTPTFAGFMRRETEKLVCSVGDEVYVAEKGKEKLTVTCYACADIHYLEAGAVLLKDWLEIRGRTTAGTYGMTRFKFNAVTEVLFKPIVDKIRSAAGASGEVDRETELNKLEAADLLSFKFRNYARRSLPPGAQFVASLGQPEISQTVVKLFGFAFERTLATAHLLLLTNRELIVISDDPDGPRAGQATRYGGIWNYIPLNKIAGVEQAEQGSGLLKLIIQLPFTDRMEMLFQPDRRTALAGFVEQLKSAVRA